MSAVLEEAWFSALGAPLKTGERAEIAAYLQGLGLPADLPVSLAASWGEAARWCRQPAAAWWQAEEAERARLERGARLDPADPAWLRLTETLHRAAAVAAARAECADTALIRAAAGAATYAAYQERLAARAEVPPGHAFLRKYALYRGGRWPLGVYDGRFAIF